MLHIHRLRALLGLALTVSAYQAAAATTCKTLSDPSNTLIQSIATWLEVDASLIPVDTAFPKVDTAFPWLATCVASIDPQSVLVSLGTSQSTKICLSTLEATEIDLSSADGWSGACTTLEDTVVPCVKSAMTEAIMDALNASGCCGDFLTMIKTLFGDSVEDMVDKVLKLAANAACSERSFKNLAGAQTKEICGYSIINSMSVLGSSEDGTEIFGMLQVPNDQMCSAFAGKEFTNTKNGKTTVGFGTDNVDTMGVCLQPVDALLQYVASWPIWSATLNADGTSIALSDLFAAGKSLRGNLLISYATTEGNMPMLFLGAIDALIAGMGGSSGSTDSVATDGFVEMAKAINSYATALALHIPNNGGCTYADQSITEVYDTSAITTATTGTSSASTIAAAGVVLLLSSLLVALL